MAKKKKNYQRSREENTFFLLTNKLTDYYRIDN